MLAVNRPYKDLLHVSTCGLRFYDSLLGLCFIPFPVKIELANRLIYNSCLQGINDRAVMSNMLINIDTKYVHAL